ADPHRHRSRAPRRGCRLRTRAHRARRGPGRAAAGAGDLPLRRELAPAAPGAGPRREPRRLNREDRSASTEPSSTRGARGSSVGRMDALDILRDLTSRPRTAAAALAGQLNPVSLNARPGGHDNSVAWLLWHTGREIDAQLADLTGGEQVWRAHGFDARFALGEARRIVVEDGPGLLEYIDAALAALEDHLGTLSQEDLADVVDEQWDPPVTRGARLVSILDDAAQHIAQAAYVLGMPLRG